MMNPITQKEKEMNSAQLKSATVLAVLAIFVSASLQPAEAATTVDVTYDLADSTLDVGSFTQLNRSFAGSMTVRYTSDGGLGIVSGPATVLAITFDAYLGFGYGNLATATMTGQLLGPVTGTLSGGSQLLGLSAASFAVSGLVHCKAVGPCTSIGLVASIPFPFSGTTVGNAQLQGSVGPYGGAQSTSHTLTGNVPASGVILPGIAAINQVQIVGRELQRTGGGQTKPIPEPGTLLLLGAGTAGLALVGRATRRSRQP